MDLLNQETLGYINAERARLGAQSLVYSPELQSGVDARARDLYEIGGLRVDEVAHVRPDGSSWENAFQYLLDENGRYIPVDPYGENAAINDEWFLDAKGVISGERTLENALGELFYEQHAESPGHYKNMMDSEYDVFSTAVYGDPEANGLLDWHDLYNIQVFGRTRN